MKALNIRQLFRNFFSLGSAQVAGSLLQLLIIPFVIRKIGIENFGIIAVAQVIMFYLGTLTDYGFNQTATREVSLNRTDNKTLSTIFFQAYYSKLFLCIISFILLLLLSLVFTFIQQHFWLYCLGFMFVIGQAAMPLWFLQGLEKMQWAALATILSKLIFVLLVLVFIKGPGDAPLFLLFMGLGSLLTGFASTAIIVRLQKLKWQKINVKEIISSLKEGWPITGTNLSMNVIQYGNLFILRLFTNDVTAGYFAVAERIFFAVKQVLVIFSQAVYPKVCQLAMEGGEHLQLFFKKIFFPFFCTIIGGSILLYFLSPPILDFFTGEINSVSVFILRMFCFLLPVICLNLPGALALLAFDYKRKYFLIFFSAMLLCIVSNIVLANYFQSDGTVSAVFITEMFITAFTIAALKRILKTEDLKKKSIS